MNVSEHVRERIRSLLRERGIVVWYDPARVFEAIFLALEDTRMVKIDAAPSILAARRAADRAWLARSDVGSRDTTHPPLLIYLPRQRGTEEASRRADPFEPYALAGTTFGAHETEQLRSLARQALAGREDEVEQLFEAGTPTIAQLDALGSGTRYPRVQAALGTEVPGRVVAMLLCRPAELRAHVDATDGLLPELQRLLEEACGLEAKSDVGFEALGPALAQWLLWSEFVFDLPGVVPPALAHVPSAPERLRTTIYELCRELRGSLEHRDAYRDVAGEIERRLGLTPLGESPGSFGDRDTFLFEDRAALLRLQDLALAGELAAARQLAEKRRLSVWRTIESRSQLWRLAERVLDLLEAGAAWEVLRPRPDRPVAEHVRAYCADVDGMWRVDQAQRLVEQSAALLVDRDSLADLLARARNMYRAWLDAAQGDFLAAVARDGWPADGFARHAEAWARHAAPAIREGRRTAWVLVDALRFEMGRELGARLAAEGTVRVEPACGVIPASTPFGMAALMPGAESALRYGEKEGALVPLLGERPVISADDRRAVLRAALGDRFGSLRLGELLTGSTAQLRERVGTADVLAVFSTEIDDFGEHADPLVARRYIGEVVGDLLTAATRLVALGISRIVFVADHGFIQLPEVLPGDACSAPGGEWLLRTRRALLGARGTRGDDVVVLDAAKLGIDGPVKDVVVPRGVKVFKAGSPYFHEGVSLQECMVPVVVLDAEPRVRNVDAKPAVTLDYRSDRITSRIFSVKVGYWGLDVRELAVRVEGYAPGTTQVVAEAADCEGRDPHTGLVTLRTGVEAHVPVVLHPDFRGDYVEIRVCDAAVRQRIHASRRLRNATLA